MMSNTRDDAMAGIKFTNYWTSHCYQTLAYNLENRMVVDYEKDGVRYPITDLLTHWQQEFARQYSEKIPVMPEKHVAWMTGFQKHLEDAAWEFKMGRSRERVTKRKLAKMRYEAECMAMASAACIARAKAHYGSAVLA